MIRVDACGRRETGAARQCLIRCDQRVTLRFTAEPLDDVEPDGADAIRPQAEVSGGLKRGRDTALHHNARLEREEDAAHPPHLVRPEQRAIM